MPRFAHRSELSEEILRKESAVGRTGRLYPAEFKREAIRLVYASDEK